MSFASVPTDLRRPMPPQDFPPKPDVMTLHLSGAVAALRSVPGLHEVPPTVVQAFRPSVPTFVDRITTRIQHEVAAFAGAAGVDRRELIAFAVQSAVDLFLDLLEGRPATRHRVDELFRRMGRAEAMDGRGLDAVRAACQIASRDAWQELRNAAECDDLPASVLGPLGDTLFAYLQHLVDQVQNGYLEARRERAPQRIRRQLLQAMLTGRPDEDVRRLAGLASWEIPVECIVIVANVPAETRRPCDVPAHLLLHVADGHVVVVASADRIADARAALARLPLTSPIALSWAVSAADVRHGHRWARRALGLAASGLIERTDVIDCTDYRSALWLHADPALRRELCDDLLAPLLTKTRHQRAIQAQTLLLWLRAHESAAVIAEQMDVHEQTVRRRLRQLKNTFAPVLDEPGQKTALLMVLEAVAPAWLKEAPTATKRRASRGNAQLPDGQPPTKLSSASQLRGHRDGDFREPLARPPRRMTRSPLPPRPVIPDSSPTKENPR